MVVVMIMGMLLAIAVPNFVTARKNGRIETCLSNLKAIDEAKQQYAMENGLTSGSAVGNAAALVPTYMQAWPTGPIAGTYAANAVGTDPTFNNQNATWITTHCTGSTADSQCPF